MCRLFGLTAGDRRVAATFWLLDAPDNLDRQSHQNPDGCGIGWFDERGRALIDKQPIAAYEDSEFAREAKDLVSSTYVAHVRLATAGRDAFLNTHPFQLDNRIFAHNGAIGDLPALEKHLGDDLALVHGDTDSERIFALITREIRRCGDVQEGLTTASRWIAANLPVFSINLILATSTDLFALRYPASHELYVLDRWDQPGPFDRRSSLDMRIAAAGEVAPTVVVASEPLDDDDWQLMDPGELVRVGHDLSVPRTVVLPDPPAHPFTPSRPPAGHE